MKKFRTEFFEKLFNSLDNNAVMMRVESDGTYYPIWCSGEYTEMMEGSEEDCIRLESGGALNTIHPDDREAVEYLFKHHRAESGSNSLTIRKYTVKGNEIWVNVHYAFVEDEGEQYAYCNYTDVTAIKQSETQTKAMYEGIRSDLDSLSHDALTFLRVNVTKNIVEDVQGKDVYEVDKSGDTVRINERQDYFPLEADRKRFFETFSNESLLASFNAGKRNISDIFFTRRQNGRLCFVNSSATLRQDPISGDIMSFYTEWDYNDEMVNQTILHKALVEQYDMITYIVDGNYGVVIGNAERITKGSIFPRERTGSYSDYMKDQVIPRLYGSDEEKLKQAEALSPEAIERALDENEPYEVDVACEIDEEIFYKRFVFYVVNREAKFYILLKSDITGVVREQRERERTQSIHNSMVDQFNALADESLTVIRSNMTTGLIEDIRGKDRYPSDHVGNTIKAYAQSRLDNLIAESDRKKYIELFDMDKLIERSDKGLGPATMTAYCKRASGRNCFVRFSGSASRNPLTGNVDAFGIEEECNSEVVTEVMNEKILAGQYDMVSYIISGYYGVTIGEAPDIKKGSIFPKERDGVYMDYIKDQVIPAVPENQREATLNALSLENVEKKLEDEENYTTDVVCEIGGETFYKRFTFYAVDKGNKFYILLKSDITDVIREQAEREQTQAAYNSMLDQFNAMADESLAVQRTNLTTGLIEESRGRDLYDTDYAGGLIAESAKIRSESFLVEGDRERYEETFALDKLLERTSSGRGPATFVGYCRRQSGKQCFVKFSGSASKNPITGDVIAFGVETEYNTEMVNQVLNEKVLARQYDMITYIVSDYYGVAIGDAANIERGSIFPKKKDGVYMEYIKTQVIPAAVAAGHDEKELLDALSLKRISAELKSSESYSVDVACLVDGEVFNKQFTFYAVDRDKDFYILLKSDMTGVLQEQRERNELLANALREAEQANLAKTAFLSSMSHEIRTPMNAIIGLDSIALNDPDISEQTREYLTKIGGSAKHLLGLINDILDMSRIESGRMTIRNEEFSFREMLEQINTMVGGQCQDKGLTYDCRITGHVDDYYIGDDMKLKQVIINILGNSVKFTPEGGTVSFLVEEVARFEDKATLRFVMRDTGIGMDKEYLPKIFEAFSQEDSGRSNKYGSTGLGMAITKNIVEMMNGDIAVESEKGIGSTFTVTVTLKKTDRKTSYSDGLRPQDMRILVIDDDEVDCEHAKLILGEVGIEADTSLNGAEAVEMVKLRHARQEAYNLILVDWKMPEQDGIEVTKKIREIVGNDSAIIILTAYSWDDVMEEALAAGVDSFMAKPLFATGVLDEFNAAIQKKNIGKPEEAHRAELSGRHILLAEDMMINAEIMKKILALREMETDHAENGQLALEMFEKSGENYYDAILMDVRMPVMDGLAATQAIRALSRPDAKTVPIIAMTANAFDEDVQHSLQAGMNAHLSKPVEPEHLYETLETLIP